MPSMASNVVRTGLWGTCSATNIQVRGRSLSWVEMRGEEEVAEEVDTPGVGMGMAAAVGIIMVFCIIMRVRMRMLGEEWLAEEKVRLCMTTC